MPPRAIPVASPQPRRWALILGISGFRKGLSNKLASMGSTTAWRKFDICHVRFLPGGREAVVYLREMRQTGIEVKLQYWVRREGAAWRIYDLYRDLDLRVALNSPAFAQWRQTHSEAAGAKPASRPAAAVP